MTTQPSIDALIATIRAFPTSPTEETAPAHHGMIVHHLGRAHEAVRVSVEDEWSLTPSSALWVTRDDTQVGRVSMARGEDDEEYLRETINILVERGTLAAMSAHVSNLQLELSEAVERRDEEIRAAGARGMSQRQIAEETGISQQRIAQIVRTQR